MKNMRKVGLMVVTAMLSFGVLGITAPAHAMDTTWGCPGCVHAHR
jgi:hypothetical protein